jgi:hypothetical protein
MNLSFRNFYKLHSTVYKCQNSIISKREFGGGTIGQKELVS